ncbi:conserved hypothetical protein [uncultured Desulfobacterium sp.]|uniref:Uncharacterized protein n=1 Tax=uncultured Desulfobacterium sp. TaxID=201089 RepID=A0A445MSU1_9BACT|nr:conserved hypothetical protein [uncultured Desulfobacterium sp.]
MTESRKTSGDKNLLPEGTKGEFLVYRSDNGNVKLEVRLEQETVWLT